MTQTFEQGMKRLEELEELMKKDLPLEDLLSYYKEAKMLCHTLETSLEKAKIELVHLQGEELDLDTK